MRKKITQTEKIKAALLKGESLTNVTAFQQHYITRLGSIIDRLRKKHGWPIVTTRGKNNGLASYSLPENWKP